MILKHKLWALGLGFFALLMAGLGASAIYSQARERNSEGVGGTASQPYRVEAIGDGVPFDTTTMAQRAEIVALGTVRKIGPARWSTADGKRPANPHAENQDHSIYRPAQFEVDEYIVGKRPHKTLTIVLSGGTIGNDSIKVSGPGHNEFKEGDRMLVFLIQRSPPGQPKRPLLLPLDRYLISGSTASRGAETLPLSQLRKEIHRVKAD